MAVRRGQTRGGRAALDERALERVALRYVERYATTRAKLALYLRRKLRERGWAADDCEPPVEMVVRRIATLGYIDDRGFAEARADTLGRRGFGERRVAADLRAAGIDEADSLAARDAARSRAFEAARRFAEKRRVGPFASGDYDPAAREKLLAAMLRAGHPIDLARKFVSARPGEMPEPDDT